MRDIRRAFAQVGITTRPDFAGEYIDAEVTFVSSAEELEEEDYQYSRSLSRFSPSADEEEEIEAPVSTGDFADPSYRIKRLHSANARPVSANPDMTVDVAMTIMLRYDYSQLPVMTGQPSSRMRTTS